MSSPGSEFNEIVLFENRDAGADGADWEALLVAVGLDVSRTLTSLDALARQAPSRDGLLLIAGGDGTINEVVWRVIDRGCTLAVLPAGTGNDLARSLGVPLDPDRACRALADASKRLVDVAKINDQVLLNAAHIGIGSVVSERYAGRFKDGWGRLSYLRGLVAQLFGRSGFRATIRIADHIETHRWRNITIANGRFFGGGHTVDRDARLDDGLLDVLAFKQRPWWRLVWAALLKRFGFGYPDALRHWRVDAIEIESSRPRRVVVDGDVRTRTPLSVRVHPSALRVLVAQAGPGLKELEDAA